MAQGLNDSGSTGERKRMPLWLKLALGFGTLSILSCVGICGGGAWWIKSTTDTFSKKFTDQGYKNVSSQVLVVEDPVDVPTIFSAQQLSFKGEVNADIAILAQVTEISGTINGDIDVLGQLVQIKKDAVINGDIRADWTQVIVIEGTVTGTVTGNYQALDDRRTNTGGAAVDVMEGGHADGADKATAGEPVEEPASPL